MARVIEALGCANGLLSFQDTASSADHRETLAQPMSPTMGEERGQ